MAVCSRHKSTLLLSKKKVLILRPSRRKIFRPKHSMYGIFIYEKHIRNQPNEGFYIPYIECRKGMLHNWSLKMPNIPKTLHDFQAAACLQATATTKCNHQGAAEAAKL